MFVPTTCTWDSISQNGRRASCVHEGVKKSGSPQLGRQPRAACDRMVLLTTIARSPAVRTCVTYLGAHPPWETRGDPHTWPAHTATRAAPGGLLKSRRRSPEAPLPSRSHVQRHACLPNQVCIRGVAQ